MEKGDPRARWWGAVGLSAAVLLVVSLGLRAVGEPEVVEMVEVRDPIEKPVPDPGAEVASLPVALDRVTVEKVPVAPLESSATPDGLVQFRMVDTNGDGFSGAVLTVSDGEEAIDHIADEVGLVALPPAEVAGALVSAWAEGQAVDCVHLGTQPSPVYTLTLEPGTSISGVAAMVDGEPVPPGARVFVGQPVELMPWARDMQRWAALPQGSSAPIREDGSFEVHGLKQGVAYSVVAYAGGVYAPYDRNLSRVIAPEVEVDVSLLYLSAINVELEAGSEAHGRFLRSMRQQFPDLRDEPACGCWLHIDNASHMRYWGVLSTRLAGLGAGEMRATRGIPERFFMHSTTREGVAVKGRIELQVPNCAPVETDFVAGWAVDGGSIPTVVLPRPKLPVSWSANAMGSLEIAFDAPWLNGGQAEETVDARVRLWSVARGDAEPFTLAAEWDRTASDGAGAFVVQDVPEGRYDAWFFDGLAGTSIPDRHRDYGWPVDIRPGERGRIDATNVPLAAVELHVLDPAGLPYSGALACELLSSPNGRWVGSYCLSKAPMLAPTGPFRFPLIDLSRLKPGYTLLPHFSNVSVERKANGRSPLAIDATPGKVTKLVVQTLALPRLTQDGKLLAP